MERKKIKFDHNNDQLSNPMTSASNTTAVNESSSRDQDSRRILGDATTQTDNHSSDDSAPLNCTAEGQQRAPSSQPEGSISTAMLAATSNQASLYQLQPSFDSLYQPGSSSDSASDQFEDIELQKVFDTLTPLPKGIIAPENQSLPPLYLYDNQLRTLSTNSAPQWNDIRPLKEPGKVQQTPLPPHQKTTPEPHTQLQPHYDSMNQPGSSSDPFLDKIKALELQHQLCYDYINLVLQSNGLDVNFFGYESPINSDTLPATYIDIVGSHQGGRSSSINVLPARAFQVGKNSSQLQRINAELYKMMQSQPSPIQLLPIQETQTKTSTSSKGEFGNTKVPFDLPANRTWSGPGSTPRIITANDESNRAAKDTDRSSNKSDTNESDEMLTDSKGEY